MQRSLTKGRAACLGTFKQYNVSYIQHTWPCSLEAEMTGWVLSA